MIDRIKSLFTSLGLDWFLLAILTMVLMAYFVPAPGMITQPLSLADLANYGVSGIFFFYGLKLNGQKLKMGLGNWKMHVVIQFTTFLIFPLLILIIKPFFGSPVAKELWLGIFFLAALPSTVSSSVVMVSLAGGNIPAAIFNASISALIGVVITPLWIGLFLQSDAESFDMTGIAIKLTLQVLVPVIIGILLNKRLGYLAELHKKALKFFDQLVILLIVYTSFCKSFAEHLFIGLNWYTLLVLATGMLLLFLATLIVMNRLSKALKFSRPDTITVMFCGSKKSLVHGTVMSGILFAGNPMAGILLLPLMFYHALQLIAASILAKRLALSSNHH
ncbi:hypothetical protein CNR22_04625 [Sphingobacteriaceae bacterium]|nr:hypothetical protein CNR22_04625 [Sphingobacteriaceae bacterium]